MSRSRSRVVRTLVLGVPLLGLALQGWTACPMHSVTAGSGTVVTHEHCLTTESPSSARDAPKGPRAPCCDLMGCAGATLMPASPTRPDLLVPKPQAVSLPLHELSTPLFLGRLERPPKPTSL